MEKLKTLTLITLIVGAPALAVAGVSLGDRLGTDEAEIRAAIEAQGYIVQEIEFEQDKIEVEVLKDGVETELVLNQADGTVTGIEADDD